MYGSSLVRKLLQMVHPQLCSNCEHPYIIYTEACGVAVGPYQQSAFHQLKESLCVVLVLLFPDPQLSYTVVTDAFGIAAGGS